MFNERKVGQQAVYLLFKTDRRSMTRMKLMKLLYLADREAINQLGAPISGDRLVSMPLGPCLSTTLNLINGSRPSSADGWDSMLRNSNDDWRDVVALLGPPTEGDLSFYDELSRAELKILDEIWVAYGHMTAGQLVDWTHENLPEWIDPGSSSSPISVSEIGQALGLEPDEVEQITSALAERDALRKMLANA